MTNIKKPVSQSYHSGGRKTARACIQLIPGSGTNLIVNGKTAADYFQNNAVYLQNIQAPNDVVKTETNYDIHVLVEGGGLSAQAQAVRLALSKAFAELFPDSRKSLKKPGFLTRDARIKERRKAGLKKARKAPQFSKR
jgi:small subunit ribosomal protein S9